MKHSEVYVSVNSKPDHPPGKPPGNIFGRANSPLPGHKESVKPPPLEQINRAKAPLPGQLFLKTQQKNHKTWWVAFKDIRNISTTLSIDL